MNSAGRGVAVVLIALIVMSTCLTFGLCAPRPTDDPVQTMKLEKCFETCRTGGSNGKGTPDANELRCGSDCAIRYGFVSPN